MKPEFSKCFQENRNVLTNIYLALFLFFTAGFFFFQTAKQLNNFFYIAIAMPALGICIFGKFRDLLKSSYFKILLVFSIWVLLSGLLNISSAARYLNEVKPLLYIFLCSVAVFYLSKERPKLPLFFFYTLILTASISSFFLLYGFYQPRDWNFLIRLSGSGAISNPIWVGAIYGLASLAAILLSLLIKKPKQRVIILLSGLPPFLVLLASQSRGPLLALGISIVYVFLLFWKKRIFPILVLLLLGVVVVGAGYDFIRESTRLLNGDDYRIHIWSNAIEQILISPLIGHGIESETINFFDSDRFEHFHNVYLTLVYHCGLIGLFLFLFLTFRPFFYSKTDQGQLLKPLIVFGLIYMLFNGSQIFTGPKELWLIFWLPLIMLWVSVKGGFEIEAKIDKHNV